MLGTQEHIDLMAYFERVYPKHARGSYRLDRETKSEWPKGRIYQHAPTNDAFLLFRIGYSFGVTVGRDDVAT